MPKLHQSATGAQGCGDDWMNEEVAVEAIVSISKGQQQLLFSFDCLLNQIPDDWHKIAVRFRRVNGIRDGDRERSMW
jgi:hypothetical protein